MHQGVCPARNATRSRPRRFAVNTRVPCGWARHVVAIPERARVLDVGSGAFPNERADVLCERDLVRPGKRAVVDRALVVADGQALPFRTDAFDFVVASHLAEHVDDPDRFCLELARISRAGYIETPSPAFEWAVPTANHRWRVSADRSGLEFRPTVPVRGVRRLVVPVFAWILNLDEGRGHPVSLFRRFRSRFAWLVRGAANRIGIANTSYTFGPDRELRVRVR